MANNQYEENPKLSPFKTWALTRFPFIEADFDSLTNYELYCKIAEELNKVINSQNITNENVKNLYDAFIELQNYFNNLNVQDEINNKLDIMVEDGTFNTILAPYNFNYLNVKTLGAKGDGITDDTEVIKNAILQNLPLYFPNGTYIISETIVLNNDTNWIGQGNKTIFNSRPISDLNPNYIEPLFDFSNVNNLILKGFTSENSTFKILPTSNGDETIKELMKNKTINIENVTNNIDNNNMSGKTNWQGLFINTPAPDNYNRDFHNGKYSRYAIDINNNSGYNAININNVIKDENGNYETITDNSAIGIEDGVLGSAPTVYIDMHAKRNAINIKNRTGSDNASSTSNPDSVFQIGYQGHLAIGCSVYDETGAKGTSTIKIKDTEPSIKFYEINDPALGMIRQQNGKMQFLVNGLPSFEINKEHMFKTPFGFTGRLIGHDSGINGAIGLKSDYNNLTYNIFINENGFLTMQAYTDNKTPSTTVGYKVLTNKNGTTRERPTSLLTNDWQSIGYMYFDTTLNKPIWWDGSKWIDSTGTQV